MTEASPTLPADLYAAGSDTPCISNYDQCIDPQLQQRLKDGKSGNHFAWNFRGYLWFADGQFHEEVWRYNRAREVISADTLEDLREAVNDKYGWD
jgi:hypothetical protein